MPRGTVIEDARQRERNKQMPPLPPDEQSVATIPRAAAFAEVYDRMLELAAEHLTEPLTAEVNAYEDGTFRIVVYHHLAGQGRRQVLYYHTERSDGEVRYAIEDNEAETITDERVVTSIEPGEGS